MGLQSAHPRIQFREFVGQTVRPTGPSGLKALQRQAGELGDVASAVGAIVPENVVLLLGEAKADHFFSTVGLMHKRISTVQPNSYRMPTVIHQRRVDIRVRKPQSKEKNYVGEVLIPYQKAQYAIA